MSGIDTANHLVDGVGAFVDRHDLLPAGSAVLLAVSGGADSVALLAVMDRLARRERRHYRLSVAHLDHGLRPGSPADAAFVAELAERLGWPFITERRDVAERAAQDGVSIELAARRVRYEFLEAAAGRAGCSVVATAHHADDNIETVLHRILRGTGLQGLRGIRPRRRLWGQAAWLVRPLLELHREQIERYLTDMGMTWRTDPSNASVAHTRNRIRHQLLPLLREQFNPQVGRAITRLAATAEWAGQWLDALGEKTLTALLIDQSDRQLTIASAGLARKDPLAASEAVRVALTRLGAPLRAIGMDHVERVLGLLDGPTGKRLNLPGGLTVRREYDRLVLELGTGTRPPAGAEVHQLRWDGATPLPDGATIRIEHRPGGPAELAAFRPGKTVWVEMLDAAKLVPPLGARRRREGDRFEPLGAPGRQKLSDFFISAKVPPADRAAAWIICDRLGPVWVAPYRIDQRVRVGPQTRQLAVLHLTAAPSAP